MVATVLNGCAGGIKGGDYLNREPTFVIEQFFQGHVKAWGMIQDRSGKVLTRFEADIKASWEGNKGVLDETFKYLESGERQKRVWNITKTGEFSYVGTAGDIIGVATGKQFGNAVNWVYSMNVPVGEKTVKLKLWNRLKKKIFLYQMGFLK